MRLQRLRERVEVLTAKPQSRVLALLLLAAILFFALPLGIGAAVLSVDILAHVVGSSSNSGAAHADDTLTWLFMLVALPAVSATAAAALAVSGVCGALGWHILRRWRTA